MKNHEFLLSLRDKWLQQVLDSLTKDEDTRREFTDQLDDFFDLLVKAVENEDPGWLKPLIIEWVQSRTEADIDEKTSLHPIMSAIASQTQKVINAELESKDAVRVMESLMPVITYCYEEISFNESLLQMNKLSSELDMAKLELERIDKSKSDFISVAAHELKTPLTLIEGYASMLREKYTQGEQDQSSVALLKGIDIGTRRLGEIVSDMIDVSLIDNELLALNFQPTWINRLLDLLKKELSDSISERKQTLLIHKFEGTDEMTYADSERLYQVFYNVLTNAIKYTPDGGKITVDGRKLAGFIEVLISDTGIGVNSENKDKIFEKFGVLGNAALHSSGKLKFKGGGPGLGLPIVKGILEAHGGAIWVESEGHDEINYHGSTFHILIPVRDEPPDEKLIKAFPINPDGIEGK